MLIGSYRRSHSSLKSFMRTEDEVLYETLLESFPASDPPACVFGPHIPPTSEAEGRCFLRSRGELPT